MTDHLVMDRRDRAALFDLMRPFMQSARPHLDMVEVGVLSVCITVPMSVDEVTSRVAAIKEHLDAVLAIKAASQKVRDSFAPKYPLVSINLGEASQ
jgi:hypothetical protein